MIDFLRSFVYGDENGLAGTDVNGGPTINEDSPAAIMVRMAQEMQESNSD